MMITGMPVPREMDARGPAAALMAQMQTEIAVLRAELRRLREWITHLEGQAATKP